MQLAEAIETITDIPTTVMLFFMTTPKEKFIREIVRRVQIGIKNPAPARMYIFFQEGISKKKSKRIWEECANRAAAEIDGRDAATSFHIRSFGNVPTEIMQVFFEHPNIEVT